MSYGSVKYNPFDTVLLHSINPKSTTIEVVSASGLPYQGTLVIDRTDSVGNFTPSCQEFIEYDAVRKNKVHVKQRGFAGSSAMSHTTGARVEVIPGEIGKLWNVPYLPETPEYKPSLETWLEVHHGSS